jgi:glucoamylase
VAATDGGKLVQASALMLKVQEDRTHAGALIASLSNPWGDTVDATKPSTGYKAVWPRDFYQCAMALAALGDKETPLAAFHYLPTVQVGAKTPGNKGKGGWFLQKSEVDGTPEWVGVQLDQTAMPIMLGWKLWKLGWLSGDRAQDLLRQDAQARRRLPGRGRQGRPGLEPQHDHPALHPAGALGRAGRLLALDHGGGDRGPGRGRRHRRGPATKPRPISLPQDRRRLLVEGRGPHGHDQGRVGDGHYYLRLNSDQDADNKSPVEERNGQAAVPEDKMLDAGFLELVRYGVRRADDPAIVASLPKLDDESMEDLYRVRYGFKFPGVEGTFPGWRRYGVDGYGEDTKTGANYGADGRCVRASAAGCGRSSPASAATTSWLWPVSRASPTPARSSRSARPMSRPWSSSPMKAC